MKLRFLILIMFLAVIAGPGVPQQTQGPLSKNQVMALVKAGMETPELVKLIREHGIDFDLSDDYLQALRNAGAQDPVIQALRAARPKPLTQEQVLQLVAGHVPSERAATLVKQHGIDFLADEEYLKTLRLAGGEDTLIAALREASKAALGELAVTTSPNAEVYLDGELQGRANAQGELAMKSKLGVHLLKVALAGKKEFQQSLTLAGGQAAKVEARLADLPGRILIHSSVGAEVFVDSASRGRADASGELAVADVGPGSHELRISAPGKKEYRQSITVPVGQEAKIDAPLVDLGPAPGTVRENPKDRLKYVWIPSGTFQMGCSPGDSECGEMEKPSHRVTISKGFWIGQTEVTVGAYKRFARQTGRGMPVETDFPAGGITPQNPGWVNESMPMVSLDWNDADDYCTWAGGRLPTEAEWEYAARGGSPTARYGPLDDIAWYADNSGQQRLDSARMWREDLKHYGKRLVENGNRTRGGGQKRANGFGLFDVLGNVWEWVNDWYGADYYENSPVTDPQGPAGGEKRVLRGGSWDLGPSSVRVSGRVGIEPRYRLYFGGYGCRCLWEAVNP